MAQNGTGGMAFDAGVRAENDQSDSVKIKYLCGT